MSSESTKTPTWIAYALIAAGLAARLLPHPPNVSPLTAIALFAGACLAPQWGVVVPLAAVVFSDLVLGFYDVMPFTWSAFALIGLLGWWLRAHPSTPRIAWASVLGSTLLFAITNFGVWLYGEGGTIYPKTLHGLWTCYVAALPFFRNTLAGDLVYTGAIFSLYAVATRKSLARASASTR